MTKQELISTVASATGFTKKDTAEFLASFVATVTSEIKAGNDVVLGADFGKFASATQAAKTGVAPGTGKPYSSPAKTVIKFRPASKLRIKVAS